MKNTIALLAVLVASATFAGCADMNTKHPNATAGGAAPIGVPPGAANACKADAAPDDALIGKTEAVRPRCSTAACGACSSATASRCRARWTIAWSAATSVFATGR